jgi:serine acetyltransferase
MSEIHRGHPEFGHKSRTQNGAARELGRIDEPWPRVIGDTLRMCAVAKLLRQRSIGDKIGNDANTVVVLDVPDGFIAGGISVNMRKRP